MSSDNKFIIYSSITPVVHLVNLEHLGQDRGTYIPLSHNTPLQISNLHNPSLSPTGVSQQAFDFAKCREFGSFGLWCLRLSADNREIISGSSDNAMYVYDIDAGKVHILLFLLIEFESNPLESFLYLKGYTSCAWSRRRCQLGDLCGCILEHHLHGK